MTPMKYPKSPNEKAIIDRFEPKPTTPEQAERIRVLREQFMFLVGSIMGQTPPSREQSLALTHLEDAAMYAIKAITHNEGEANGKQTP